MVLLRIRKDGKIAESLENRTFRHEIRIAKAAILEFESCIVHHRKHRFLMKTVLFRNFLRNLLESYVTLFCP